MAWGNEAGNGVSWYDQGMSDPFEPILQPRIVHEGNGVLVVAKPAGMHCAPGSQPGTLCSWLFDIRPQVALVHGWRHGEGGLLHRLDAATSGLVVFAHDDETFRFLMKSADSGGFIKLYRAKARATANGLLGSRPVMASPGNVSETVWISAIRRSDSETTARLLTGTSIVSSFRPYGPGAVRVACALTGQLKAGSGHGDKHWTKELYTTDFKKAVQDGDALIVDVALTRGFRHQVRAHMAWIGLPLEGDATYGDSDEGNALCLRACGLSFPDPQGGPDVILELDA